MKKKEAPRFLYKIVSKQLWQDSQASVSLKLTQHDMAFIHLSEREQLDKIIKKYFALESEVLVLKLDVNKLQGRLVKEKNPGGTTEYFHLYEGKIPLQAVVETETYKL